MSEQDMTERAGFDRRGFIKRAAVVGAATAWAAPTIQSLASPAFALGSAPNPGGCTACLTGGGNNIVGGTYNGTPLDSISVGVGQICCTDPGNGNAEPQLEIVLHPVGGKKKDDVEFHFDTLIRPITCSKTGNPAPPPGSADCANRFEGDATDSDGHTVHFIFEDNGEPGQNVDFISIHITGPGVEASGSGNLAHGNLQAHSGLAGLTRDCSGC